MANKYNEVELSEEEIASLDETTESQNAEVETAKPESEETSNEVIESEEDDRIEIDGERYDMDTIMSWRDDANNKDSWQKSNTEKAQKLSSVNKLVEKIQGDDDFKEHIKDYFYQNPKEADKLGLNEVQVLEEDPEDMTPSDVEIRLEALERIEGSRVQESREDFLESTMDDLESKHPELLGGEDTMKFLEYADKNSDDFIRNGIVDLDGAFKEWSYDAMQDQLKHYKKLDKNKSRNSGKVVTKAQKGAIDEVKPKKYKSFKDVSMDDPEIAKYFE